MPILYRAMWKADDGLHPKPGAESCHLGVRVGDLAVVSAEDEDESKYDVWVGEDRLVHALGGGLSVVPDDPIHLPPWRRPTWVNGGTNKKIPLWKIVDEMLPSTVAYRETFESREYRHGLIEPSESVLIDQFQESLASTATAWEEATEI